jgi:hypothetical protein
VALLVGPPLRVIPLYHHYTWDYYLFYIDKYP